MSTVFIQNGSNSVLGESLKVSPRIFGNAEHLKDRKTNMQEETVDNLNREQIMALEISRKFSKQENCILSLNDRLFSELVRQDIVEILSSNIFTVTEPKYITCAQIKCSKNKLYYSFLYHELKTFFYDLRNIDYAVTKGLVAALNGYDKVEYRGSSDVDILVDRHDISYVSQILKKHGFYQGFLNQRGEFHEYERDQLLFFLTQTHQMAPFYKYTGNRLFPYICVDINFDLLWGESPVSIDVKEFVSDAILFLYDGVEFKALDLEKSLFHLCLHNYKENNSLYLICNDNCFKLRRYFDVYFTLKNHQINLSKFIALTNKYQVGEYIYHSLFYSYLVFLEPIEKLFESWRNYELIGRYGLKEDEYQNWDMSFLERVFDKSYIDKIVMKFSEKERKKILANQHFMKKGGKEHDY